MKAFRIDVEGVRTDKSVGLAMDHLHISPTREIVSEGNKVEGATEGRNNDRADHVRIDGINNSCSRGCSGRER